MPIPIVDLFAGPGGLGEGFSSLTDDTGKRAFKIRLSIEKDAFAHRTLQLRAFFRAFDDVPIDYYLHLAGRMGLDELYSKYGQEARTAAAEAWQATLGSPEAPPDLVDRRIAAALKGARKWVLIGGPPCQAYSLAGRSRIIGEKGIQAYEADDRHELYLHYLRILAKHKPPVFVMENVKGLLSARVKEQKVFGRMLGDLRHPYTALPELITPRARSLEYRLVSLTKGSLSSLDVAPEDFLIEAEDYGIPQARHRIVILGIRSDVHAPQFVMEKAASRIPVERVLCDLPKLRSGLSRESDSSTNWRSAVQSIAHASWMNEQCIAEEVRRGILSAALSIRSGLNQGANYIGTAAVPSIYHDWFFDAKVGGVCNHETRNHMREDLHRYLFATVYARATGFSPRLQDFPVGLLPEHKNVDQALQGRKFNDRFRVQMMGRPSTTVVSHIAKDGHYFIHYDSTQCRSLTVREAARLQTFPDNYFFEGPRTEQYKQVGNAVPPLLAKQISSIVARVLEYV